MPSWGELQYELPDARLVQAQREILRWYGKKVDIDTKAKVVS